MATIQDALSKLLLAMGFEAMANGVLREKDEGRLRMYARVVRNNCKRDFPHLAARVEDTLGKVGL